LNELQKRCNLPNLPNKLARISKDCRSNDLNSENKQEEVKDQKNQNWDCENKHYTEYPLNKITNSAKEDKNKKNRI